MPKVQAFIFSWRNFETAAMRLYEELRPLTPVTVINSDEEIASSHPNWCNLSEDAYFAAQWNCLLDQVSAEIVFHIQADAKPMDFEALLNRGVSLMTNSRIGIYEPSIDFTDIQFLKADLEHIADEVFAVPFTDTTCWMIAASVLSEFPRPCTMRHSYGWGIAPCAAVIARRKGFRVVRDYSQRVTHPRGRGYSTAQALAQRRDYFETLSPDIAKEIYAQYEIMMRHRELLARASEDVS
jgi:hypothetical protein